MSIERDIRVVVAIDFGTTFSGFAYANKVNPEIVTNDTWPEQTGVFKTNTVLQYDSKWNVTKWGYPALAQEPSRRRKRESDEVQQAKPVELFKLHLAPDMDEKPQLPEGLDFKRAIADYLREMGQLIQATLNSRWPGIRFPQQVRIILTVPAEWTDEAKAVMRACSYHSGLIESLRSEQLEFTTEPEAAAIHCMSILNEHDLQVESSFMIVDCGGGTVDLTTRRILPDNKLGEITERSGELCGSSFVDREFLMFVGRRVGFNAMNKLKIHHYGQMQYLVQQFCTKVKFLFNGGTEFTTKELDLERVCPAIMQYVTGSTLKELEEAEWLIELDYQIVKAMFDPVVDKIIGLIERQLQAGDRTCSCMFLVGGFSESRYLQARVKETFGATVPVIAVPKHPIAAVVRGALQYGLQMDTVKTRVLKWSYGVEVNAMWDPAVDPPERRTASGRVYRFHQLAQRGTEVAVDRTFSYAAAPVTPYQTDMNFSIYATSAPSARYCDEDAMRLLGRMRVDLPDPYLGKDRLVQFSLCFGQMEIKAVAHNIRTGHVYQTVFDLEL